MGVLFPVFGHPTVKMTYNRSPLAKTRHNMQFKTFSILSMAGAVKLLSVKVVVSGQNFTKCDTAHSITPICLQSQKFIHRGGHSKSLSNLSIPVDYDPKSLDCIWRRKAPHYNWPQMKLYTFTDELFVIYEINCKGNMCVHVCVCMFYY